MVSGHYLIENSKITIFHMQNLSTVPKAKIFGETKFRSVFNFKTEILILYQPKIVET